MAWKPHFMPPGGGYKTEWVADVIELCAELNTPDDVPSEKALMKLDKSALSCLVRALQVCNAKEIPPM